MKGSALLVSTATRRARRTAQWSALVALAAGLAMAPMTSAGATAAANPASGIKLPVSSAGAMLDVNGQLWVSDPADNQVDVFSTAGKLLHRVIDLPGARSLLATPDGSTVEVAEYNADAVAEISTSTYQTTGTWATDPCPWSLAWVSGLLAYSFGCDQGDWNSGVATMASPSSTPTEMLSREYSAPLLAGFSSTLAVSQQGSTPSNVSTYTVAENGTATELASLEPDSGASVTFTPDGTSLLTAAYTDAGAVAFNPATGQQQIAYPGTGQASAIGVSPNGRYIATGFAGYSSTINLVDTTTDSTVWTRQQSFWLQGQTTNTGVLPGTIAFAANSTEVFALASPVNVPGVFLFASDLHPAASHISLKVGKVPAGHKLPVALTGTPGAHVTLTSEVTGALPRTVLTLTLPASGHTTRSFTPTLSGTLVATVAGDPAHLSTTSHVAYSVGSRSVATALGGHRTHGITYYTKVSQVRVGLLTKPLSDVAYAGTPQAYFRGRWVSGLTLHGWEQNGRGGMYFKSLHKNVKYRVTFTIPTTDLFRGSHATSGVFELR